MQCKASASAFTKTKAYQQVSNIELQIIYFMWKTQERMEREVEGDVQVLGVRKM